MAGALAGRRVVVTRALEQADTLADLLRQHGAEPVVVPLIEIVPDPDGVASLARLQPLEFDWLVVTSPNGAQAFAQAHTTAPAQVAAVGATTAAALTEAGVEVTVVPTTQRAAGLLAELPAGPGRVLVVQAVDADPALTAGLTERGWTVTIVAPYRSAPARPAAGVQLAAMAADAVLFASGSAARAWVAVFGTASPPIVVAIGPQTSAVAERAGLKVTAVAADHSLAGMVSALERSIANVE